MIELRVNGITIVVPKSTAVNREFETTLFSHENTVSDFTLPVDLPLTDDIIKALNFPNVLANPNLKRDYECDVIVDGIYQTKSTLRVLSTKLKGKTCSVSIIGNYGSFSRIVGDAKVNSLTLDGVRTIGNANANYVPLRTAAQGSQLGGTSSGIYLDVYYKGSTTPTHMYNVLTGATITDYIFGITCDEKINLEFIHDSLKTDEEVISIINAYDTGMGGYTDPLIHYFNAALGTSGINDAHFSSNRLFWVPQFRLVYILRKSFEEFGFTVSGDIFTDPEFFKIVLHNTFAINSYSYTLASQGLAPYYDMYIDCKSTSINPQNHVPRISIKLWHQEVAKIYNLQYIIDYSSKTVRVVRLKNTHTLPVVDLTSKAFPEPEIKYEKDNFVNGYEFSFDWDANDGASGENVQDDVRDYAFLGSVNSKNVLNSFSGAVVNDIAYVRAENAYYQFGGSDWFFYSHNMGKYKTSNATDLQKISCKVVPMPMKLIPYTSQSGTSVIIENWVMPYSSIGMEGTRLLGIDVNNILTAQSTISATVEEYVEKIFHFVTFRLDAEINPHVALDIGTGSPSILFPSLSCAPYGVTGGPIGSNGYAQTWHVPDGNGLVMHWWQTFVDMLAQSIGVEYRILLDAVTYSGLDLNSTIIRIDYLNYLCRKAEITMPFPAVSKLLLVRI